MTESKRERYIRLITNYLNDNCPAIELTRKAAEEIVELLKESLDE